jgi:hypothetical protein
LFEMCGDSLATLAWLIAKVDVCWLIT